MDECYKKSSNIFSRTPMNASECLDNLAYFLMVFKMCGKIIGTKAKRNHRYSWEQN